ncbi:MAG TPA: leucyl aminopeptidase [Actinomycetota bacterium]|nr:leucyl aminopeptidase [Actinomycetota bacterium]
MFSLTRERVLDAAAEVIAVPVFKGGALGPGAKEVLGALGQTLEDLIDIAPLMSNPFKGDLGEVIAVPTLGKITAKQVLIVGCGDKGKQSLAGARKAGATVARKAGGARTVVTTVPQAIKGKADEVAAAFAEGFLLASYKYERYKNEQIGKPNRVSSVAVVAATGWDPKRVKQAFERAQVIADGTNLARDLVNTPSGDKSPESLAAEARRIAKNGLKVAVFDEKQLEAKGFGGIIGVGRGSVKPPRLIQLRYEPQGARKTVAIVGKGITFDSGGINLKPSEGLDWMKMDMGGAAAVLGAMQAIAALKPKVRVHAYIASAENMPDGNATRPGDVVTHYGGKTTEIGNTDAEGRLVMADAIVYAKEQGADVILDVATLTGACMVALGHWIFGVMGNPRAEAKKVLDAAERAGEAAWELPLFEPYAQVLKSEIADLRNIANRNIGGGAITAGLFLKEFAGDTPYVHLDIAGPAKSDDDSFERVKGATGAGVRTLVEYVLSQ